MPMHIIAYATFRSFQVPAWIYASQQRTRRRAQRIIDHLRLPGRLDNGPRHRRSHFESHTSWLFRQCGCLERLCHVNQLVVIIRKGSTTHTCPIANQYPSSYIQSDTRSTCSVANLDACVSTRLPSSVHWTSLRPEGRVCVRMLSFLPQYIQGSCSSSVLG